MRYLAALFVIFPLPLAWLVTGNMCGFRVPTEVACLQAADGYWDVFWSFLIMFTIAFWVGGGLTFALLRLRGHDGPSEEDHRP